MRERVIVVITLSVVLSVADFEDGGLLALQRDMNLNRKTIEVLLIYHFLEIRPCSREKAKTPINLQMVKYRHTIPAKPCLFLRDVG